MNEVNAYANVVHEIDNALNYLNYAIEYAKFVDKNLAETIKQNAHRLESVRDMVVNNITYEANT